MTNLVLSDADLFLKNIWKSTCDLFMNFLEPITTTGFQNFIRLKFLRGSPYYLIAWIFTAIILICILKYAVKFVRNWYKWIFLKPAAVKEGMKDCDNPAFTVRLDVLKGKASRLSMKLWGELEDMEKGGMSSPKNPGYETYKQNLALATAYDEMVEAKPTTFFDLEELEWKFNEGKLRTPEEIEEHEIEVQQKLYESSGQYAFELGMLEEEFFNVHTLTGCVVAAISFSAILCICCVQGCEPVMMAVTTLFLGIPLTAVALFILYAVWVFIDLTFESKFYIVAKKAGKKYLPHLQTGVDFAGLVISTLSIRNFFKRKK